LQSGDESVTIGLRFVLDRRFKLRTVSFAITLTLGVCSFAQAPADAPYMNPNLPTGQRAADLVSRMTL